jgi:hypothetical protein
MTRLAALAVILAVACGSTAEAPGAGARATGSATAAATASPIATASAAPTPSPTATTKPNPTAGPATYTSLAYGYRIDLPTGWRRSACQSTRAPAQPPGIETFTNATVEAEAGTDTGPAHDVVLVRIEDNSGGETALGWLESGKMGFSMGSKFEKITFDNNPDAARIVTTDGATTVAIVLNARFRIYAVSRGLREPTPASEAAARSLMTSLHILRENELADAKATLATPPAAPARSVEEVADALVRGFGQKDTAALASVATECLDTGLENAGVGFRATSVSLLEMNRSFATGLVVTVQARPIEFAPAAQPQATEAALSATWTDPGKAPRKVKLMLNKVGNTWYWHGVLYLQG